MQSVDIGNQDVKPGFKRISGIEIGKHFLVFSQLGLLWWLIFKYEIEAGLGLPKLFPLVVGGFVINALLPRKFKLPFFLLLCIGAIFYLFSVQEATYLIIAGLGLIGLCHVPVKFFLRTIFVLLCSAFIIAVRASIFEIPEADPFLPILGAMFMFRLMLYVYELSIGFKPSSVWHVLTYFFLLPNMIFPIFPIVDFKTFNRAYYSRNSSEIYQKGVRWIMRGFLHLVLYRIIYYYFLLAPDQVFTVFSLAYFMATTYILVLRLSGIFHIAVGIICLFGFDLPQAFNNYFLASSFSDLWRRINIYWHDFIMKVFYYPIFFRLRKIGNTSAIFISVLIVFLITWQLHSFQWFWIKGSFPVTVIDAVFWMVFGILLAFNSIFQQKKQNKKPVISNIWNLSQASIHVLKIIGIFTFMSVIWSFWTSTTVSDWMYLIERGINCSGIHFIRLILIILAVLVIGILIHYLNFNVGQRWKIDKSRFFKVDMAVTILVIMPFALYSIPSVSKFVEDKTDIMSETIFKLTLNERDRDLQIQGYYENLLVRDDILNPLSDLNNKRNNDKKNINKKGWGTLGELGVLYPINDLRSKAHYPNKTVIFKDGVFTTNNFGLRDKEYSPDKTANTIRIAVLGNSQVMGSGVNDEEVFENLLENKLTKHFGKEIQCWNYAMSKFSIIEQVDVVNKQVSQYSHDIILYMNNGMDLNQSFNYLLEKAKRGKITEEYPFLYHYTKDANLFSIDNPFGQFKTEITKACYEYIVARSREMNCIPVWVSFPLLGHPMQRTNENETGQKLAREAGFYTISLSGVYDGHDRESLKIAEWDNHPNAKGHELIADMLFEELLKLSKELGFE